VALSRLSQTSDSSGNNSKPSNEERGWCIEKLLKQWGNESRSSGVQFRRTLSLVKSGQQGVEFQQRLLGNERLPSEGQRGTAGPISHPSRQALPSFGGLDINLAICRSDIAPNDPQLLAAQRMGGVLDFDLARIAGIIWCCPDTVLDSVRTLFS